MARVAAAHRIGWLASRLDGPARRWIAFGLLLTVAAVGYGYLAGTPAFRAVAGLTAGLTAALLSLLGNDIVLSGLALSMSGFTAEVGAGCTGIEPILLFASAMLVSPVPGAIKLRALLIGGPMLYGVNLVRIVSLFYVGAFLPRLFETVHLLIWQSLMVLAVLALWLHQVNRHAPVR